MKLDLGAIFSNGNVQFKVWAPFQSSLQIAISGSPPLEMFKGESHYFYLEAHGLKGNEMYEYILPNGQKRADPVSRYLPKGINGPSAVVDPGSFDWTDPHWKRPPMKEMIFYECHIGTLTESGTFLEALQKIDYLKDLGINCLEIMPVAQFSGKFGWGYDGVSLYAPHQAYGTPNDLKMLINRCHEQGIAVCLDVVYNHFGPEGCYLGDFGPYWTDAYLTPWGKAVNVDGRENEGVRNYFIQNALYWIQEYHIDVLRLDALHAIFDFSAQPFLQELAAAIGDKAYLIGESDRNDNRLIREYRLSGLWNEDFHHALHVALTGENQGYYQDFLGLADLKSILEKNLVYDGKYSKFRKRRHGNSFKEIPRDQLVVFSQNHDQIGNRVRSDRLQLPFELEKAMAFFVMLNSSLPLLFMGQEYGERNPFEYFVDYENAELVRCINEGRKKDCGALSLPDEAAFLRSKISWNKQEPLFSFYRALIAFRKSHPVFQNRGNGDIRIISSESDPFIAWQHGDGLAFLCYFEKKPQKIRAYFPFKNVLLHSEEERFGGKGPLEWEEDDVVLERPVGIVSLIA